MLRVELGMFWPPIETWRLVRDNGDIVAGHVSNGDFHWKSPNPLLATEAINGQINTPVGWVIPLLTKALNEPFAAILV